MYKAYRVEQHSIRVDGRTFCIEERWYINKDGLYTTNIEAAAVLDHIPERHYGVIIPTFTQNKKQ